MLDPILAARLAEAVGDVYADAEVTLLKMIADRLTRGLESPQWAERQLIEVQNLRTDARRFVSQVDRVATAEIESAVATLTAGWCAGRAAGHRPGAATSGDVRGVGCYRHARRCGVDRGSCGCGTIHELLHPPVY